MLKIPNLAILNQELSKNDIKALIAYHEDMENDDYLEEMKDGGFWSSESEGGYHWQNLGDFLECQAEKFKYEKQLAFEEGEYANQKLLQKALGLEQAMDNRLCNIEKNINRWI